MSQRPRSFAKPELKPKKRHGFTVLLCIMGTLFPPLAVAIRFGIGGDFFLNLLLTICGYIPGHVHNFYIQNIRNNKNNRRTPKWVQKYGLVDTSSIRRRERRSQWANRYNERLPSSALGDQPYEEDQVPGGSATNLSSESGDRRQRTNSNGEFWNRNEERYYNANADSTVESSPRWRYPANFEDVAPDMPAKRTRRKKDKKDRFARTEDAYSLADGDSGIPRRKSKRRSQAVAIDDDAYSRNSSSVDIPEDPEGGLYGPSRGEREQSGLRASQLPGEDPLNQEV